MRRPAKRATGATGCRCVLASGECTPGAADDRRRPLAPEATRPHRRPPEWTGPADDLRDRALRPTWMYASGRVTDTSILNHGRDDRTDMLRLVEVAQSEVSMQIHRTMSSMPAWSRLRSR